MFKSFLKKKIRPGVYVTEIDFSTYLPKNKTGITAIVGNSSEGPINRAEFIGDIIPTPTPKWWQFWKISQYKKDCKERGRKAKARFLELFGEPN